MYQNRFIQKLKNFDKKSEREMACTFAKKMEMFASMNKKNSSIFMTAKLIGESIQDLLHAME